MRLRINKKWGTMTWNDMNSYLDCLRNLYLKPAELVQIVGKMTHSVGQKIQKLTYTFRTFFCLKSQWEINDNFIQIPSHFPMEFPAKGLTHSPQTQYKSQQRDLHSWPHGTASLTPTRQVFMAPNILFKVFLGNFIKNLMPDCEIRRLASLRQIWKVFH